MRNIPQITLIKGESMITRKLYMARAGFIVVMFLLLIAFPYDAIGGGPKIEIEAVVDAVVTKEGCHFVNVVIPDGNIHTFTYVSDFVTTLKKGDKVTIKFKTFYMLDVYIREPYLSYMWKGIEMVP